MKKDKRRKITFFNINAIIKGNGEMNVKNLIAILDIIMIKQQEIVKLMGVH